MPRSDWPDIQDDLRRVLEHPGFVELSKLDITWKVGVRLGGDSKDPEDLMIALGRWGRITWFSGASLPAVLTQAICALERLGPPIRIAEGT